MALYLPQENPRSGQLEFMPAVIFPHPSSDRIFIANQAKSGLAPRLPTTLTTLPGFEHATSLLPDYPMVAGSTEVGVGVVEEVLCDVGGGGAALSVPLFAGSQTVGVLLVSPAVRPTQGSSSVWTSHDREQVSRAAQSLSIALSMDAEKSVLQVKHKEVQKALSDSLHQVKNPLQALRTFGKLLQQRIAESESGGQTSGPQLLELVDLMMVQSDRLIDRLKPVDGIVDTMAGEPLLLPFASTPSPSSALVPFKIPLVTDQKGDVIEFDNNVLEFGRRSARRTGSVRASSINNADDDIYGNAIVFPSTYSNSSNNEVVTEGRDSVKTLTFKTRIELEMAFIDDVLEPVLSAFSVLATENDIDFHVDSSDDLPGTLVAPDALQEAVTNLLDNAFKYVLIPKKDADEKVNPSPKVRVRYLSNKDAFEQGVTILIEDNGPGIPGEERKSIFDRGVRGQLTKRIEGSGIGLSIARTLIQQMGGTLKVADKRHYKGALDGTVMEIQVFRNPVID
ncbi:hypothetical protein FisN_4Lh401 [Fistulifera solaris]|uniref:histidine kinase n=1 Tax=Fistulifera solaris TaxID=1519565 RepID=A0A1Z5JZY1_FISSO|nr:hypothetical protein FisN_4Lh401 [Fistulifera solaris]|eukprot:GAX19422.1 hypothetical protein FisN_4Lh401 [Fistulifera solaris]